MNTEKNTKLNQLCKLITQQVDPRDFPTKLYIGLEHLSPGRMVRTGGDLASTVRSSKHAFLKGDVLYGKLRPYLDKSILAEEDGLATTELLVLRANENVDPRFLACVVHCQDFIDHAIAGTSGSQHPRTSWARISEFEIPNFSPEEQNKIADFLWHVHNLLRTCEVATEAAFELKAASMFQLFSKGLRRQTTKQTAFGATPEDWTLCKIGGLIRKAQYGLNERGELKGKYPILRMNCQDNGRVVLRDLQYVDIDETTAAAYMVNPNDLLFNRTNSYELVGRTAIVDQKLAAVFASYLVRIEVDENEVQAAFLNYFMNWAVTQSELKKIASRGVSQANISAGKLKEFEVPVPPTQSEQMEIVEILQTIDKKIEIHRQKKATLERLLSVLMHQLFSESLPVDSIDLTELSSLKSTKKVAV